MRIGITGWATSGKDEVANVLEREFGFMKVSWAHELRRDIEILNPIVSVTRPIRYADAVRKHGYVEAKVLFPELRRLLQVYGTDVHRTVDENYWIHRTLAKIPEGVSTVFPDTRFPNEAEEMDFVIGVRRPGVKAVNEHASDAGLAFPYVTAWIENSGTLEDLRFQTISTYRWILAHRDDDGPVPTNPRLV